MKMKIEAYKDDKKPDTVVRIAVIEEGGKVKVVSVDKDGHVTPGGYLLSFQKSTGKIYRTSFVGPGLGFSLDDLGRIEIATIQAP